jgi:hypothetical protein
VEFFVVNELLLQADKVAKKKKRKEGELFSLEVSLLPSLSIVDRTCSPEEPACPLSPNG